MSTISDDERHSFRLDPSTMSASLFFIYLFYLLFYLVAHNEIQGRNSEEWMNKQANKLQRHGRGRNTIARGRNCDVCKWTTTLYFSLAQLNRLKQHPTTSASESFNFTIEIKHFYSRHCRGFRFQATISPISLIYDVKSPAHLYTAWLPVVLMLMVPSFLQVTAKAPAQRRETTFYLRHLEGGLHIGWKEERFLNLPANQRSTLD